MKTLRKDRRIARVSLRDEKKAIRDYAQRERKTTSPKLDRALAANRKDELEHAARLRPFAGKGKK